jgi:BirA family transcriptional regulator, biotin operon repressor / biotin---[acetyl-CoA-carboxylase] ligase
MDNPIVHEIRRFDVLDSTNDYCFRNAESLKSGTVVMCGFQQEGKGTQGRSWRSEADKNLLFSLYYKDETFTSLPLFSHRVALGLAQVLEDCGLSPFIKWPNDMIVDDKKIAGILIEAKQNRCVVGIGFNINQEVFPDDLNLPATSLFNQTSKTNEPVGVLLKVLDALDEVLTWKDEEVLSKYRKLLYQKGKECTITLDKTKIPAIITDIAEDGALIVVDRQKRLHKIYSKAILEG